MLARLLFFFFFLKANSHVPSVWLLLSFLHIFRVCSQEEKSGLSLHKPLQALSLHKPDQVAQGDRSPALLGELPLAVRASDVLERLAAHM